MIGCLSVAFMCILYTTLGGGSRVVGGLFPNGYKCLSILDLGMDPGPIWVFLRVATLALHGPLS